MPPVAAPFPFSFAGQRLPTIAADALTALAWTGALYRGTTDLQAIAANGKGAALLLNPAGSTASLTVVGLRLSVGANATVRLAYADSASGYTQSTQVGNCQARAGDSAPAGQGQVWYDLTASDPAAFFDTLVVSTTQDPLWLPIAVALRPNSGLLVVADNPTSLAVTFVWVESQPA